MRCAREYIWKTHAHLHMLAYAFAFQAAGGKICFSSNKEKRGDRTPAGIVRLVGYTKGVAAKISG